MTHRALYISTLALLAWVFARWLGAAAPSIASAVLAGPLVIAGFALSAWCARCFINPSARLVLGGPYQYVRNPMILGNVLLLLGAAVLFRSAGIMLFTLLFWAAWHLLLVRSEEPALRRRFGPTYEAYLRYVPRWLPRVST
jgi:protein-S-isoprenylcysteine O-methyltransferase Ste14